MSNVVPRPQAPLLSPLARGYRRCSPWHTLAHGYAVLRSRKSPPIDSARAQHQAWNKFKARCCRTDNSGIDEHKRVCHNCVLSDQPVGIDVETFDHYSQEVASRVMNDNEMRQILNSPHPTIAFARLWTMKESLFKLTGDDHGGDIAHMLDDTAQYHFSTLITPTTLSPTAPQHKRLTNKALV